MAGKDFRTYSRSIPAGSEETIDATGRYVACLEASAVFKLAVDDEAFAEFEAGLKVVMAPGESFAKVRLQNTTGGAITLRVIVGDGDFEDARVVLPSGGLKLDVGDSLTSSADASVAAGANDELLAANSARRFAIVQNLDAVATIMVRSGVAATAQGLRIGPGDREKIETTAAIRVYNPSGAAVSVGLLEVAD